jgi:prepilin-type N-terminal cleavage/methylation domain-containing protein
MMQIEEIMRNRCRNNRGFTLIEIIAVLVIIAIISAVVISRGTGTDAASLQAEVDTLKGHLRYAQYLAMNDIYTTDTTSPGYATRTKWGISVGNSSYTLVKYVADAPATHTFNLPNESSATHSFNGITDASSTVNPILFDDWGSPGTANISITIGGQTITDAIKAQTGFIP